MVDPRRGMVGARFRYPRHARNRPYITLGPVSEWPPARAWERVTAIQADIDAGIAVPELEVQLKRAGQRERVRTRLARERRPVKDPVGYAYSYTRRVLQALEQFRDSTPSRDHRLLARDALSKGHAFEDAIGALMRATYDIPPYGSENGNVN